MTEEEIENNAKEYVKANICGWYDYCKDCINQNYRRIKDMCYPSKWVVNAYTNAYKQGQEHGLLMHLNIIADDYKKENEELKKKIFIQDEIISGEQTENEELKAQIEIKTKEIELIKLKMRNCLNCCNYKILKPIYESPIYDEDDLPYPCRDCENSNKWELAE